MDAARIVRDHKEANAITEVAVVDVNGAAKRLIGANGRTYHEIETNIWADTPPEEGESDVVFLGTSRHGGGIVLRPLYLCIDGTWRNATTGREAPCGMPYHAESKALWR